MSGLKISEIAYEQVAVSTRIRLARNFADYPFPNRLKNVKRAAEIIRLVAAQLNGVDVFNLYHMDAISAEQAELLKERYLISQALIDHRKIGAVLISSDESISVMINEEDHIREQYFMKGYDLQKAYERLAGVDELISEAIPFAFDGELGYLTACPTNLGTGLRASVMLFLPALSRRGRMSFFVRELKRLGLTARGAFGEGSGAEGDLFQISNEVTLGVSEGNILGAVAQAVEAIVTAELQERAAMKREGIPLFDRFLRALGVLTNCLSIDMKDFMRLISEVKLGVALGVLDGTQEELDDLVISLRPNGIDERRGEPLSEEERNVFRAIYAREALEKMQLFPPSFREELLLRNGYGI